jgi:hypothetical protein
MHDRVPEADGLSKPDARTDESRSAVRIADVGEQAGARVDRTVSRRLAPLQRLKQSRKKRTRQPARVFRVHREFAAQLSP